MTRLVCLVTACGLTSVVIAAAIAACGERLGSPGELPPMAPRPGRADPTAMPVPRIPAGTSRDASSQPRGPTPPGPVTMGISTSSVPVPVFAPVVGEPVDAGADDGYAPPLPPLPDSNLPADSRLEPRRSE